MTARVKEAAQSNDNIIKNKELTDGGRDSWIQAGLQLLASSGLNSLNVESLGRYLGLSKGSFYWHFADRRELLSAIRKAWRRREEGRFGRDGDTAMGTAERLASFLNLSSERGQAHLELAMNAWAYSDLEAAGDVAAIEQIRMSYLERILIDMGFNHDRAAWWAAALYQAFLGVLENSARLPQVREEKEQIADRFSWLILAAATLEDHRQDRATHELPARGRTSRRKA
ncbi:MAG: TetR/AcrR family transcriptional regulator [Candidatus Acidiferrales bacterium]